MPQTFLNFNSAVLIALAVSVTIYSCKKENTQQVQCTHCHLAGTYNGSFNQEAACYTCVPYLDTVFTGSFTVDTLAGDSILITRLYDNYSWRFAANDSNEYSRGGCCTVTESFEFKQPDSLRFYYNNGGSGGYFREMFEGKKQ